MVSQSLKVTVLYAAVLFIDMLEMSVLNVGIPSIAEGLNASSNSLGAAITAFIWGLTLMIPLAGWLGGRFGQKRVFIFGQLLFMFASACCYFVGSVEQLLVLRTLQGFGAGLVMPVGLTLLMQTLSMDERPGVLAKISLVPRLAPSLGPILAGYVLFYYSWRWIFLMKVPVCVLCLALSYLWLGRDQIQVQKKFDWKGLIFCSVSLGSFLLSMTLLGQSVLVALAWGTLSVGSLMAFIQVEKRASAPIIPMQLFHSKFFCEGNLLQAMSFCIIMGGSYLFSLYFQDELNFSPVVTGWVVAATTLGMIGAIPVISRFHKRLGARLLLIIGFLLMGLGMGGFAVLGQMSPWVAASFLVSFGLGGALATTTNATTVFYDISKDLMGSASSVYSLIRQMASCLGVGLAVVILNIFVGGYEIAFWMMFGVSLLGALVAVACAIDTLNPRPITPGSY